MLPPKIFPKLQTKIHNKHTNKKLCQGNYLQKTHMGLLGLKQGTEGWEDTAKPLGGRSPWHWTSRDGKKWSEEGADYYRNSRAVWSTPFLARKLSAMSRLRAGVKWHIRDSFTVRWVLGWWRQPVTITNRPKPGWGCPCPIQQCAPQFTTMKSKFKEGSQELAAVYRQLYADLMTKYTAAHLGWYRMVTGGPCPVTTNAVQVPATWPEFNTWSSPQPNKCAGPVIYP